MQSFKDVPSFYQDAAACCLSRAGKNCDGSGKSESAGACDHQYGYSMQNRQGAA